MQPSDHFVSTASIAPVERKEGQVWPINLEAPQVAIHPRVGRFLGL
jgi:hypothetical protein